MTGKHFCEVNKDLRLYEYESISRVKRSCVRQNYSMDFRVNLVLVQRTLVFVVFILVSAVVPAPVSQQTRDKRSPYNDNVMNYLTQFGYLPQSDIETGNLRTDEQLHEAIRNLQAFGNIPQTGKVDANTQMLMRKPRCGLTDLPDQEHARKKRYAIHRGSKWHHTNLTWSLRSTHLGHLDHGQVRREFYRALDIWSQPSKLTFHEMNSEHADILIYFHRGFHGDGYPFDGPGRILAHAFFPGSDRGGDVHFDEEETWLLSGDSADREGTNLFMVAAHEFGHSLGLSHSSVAGSLMYPWYQGVTSMSELPDDDRHGIQQIYGVKEKLWGRIPHYPGGWHPRIHKPTTTTTTTTTTTRRPYVTPRRKPQVPVTTKPDPCDMSYDAITVIRKETFIFKDRYVWRIGDKGLYEGFPAVVHHFWRKLPENLTHIDDVYERNDGKIVFFIGREYYVFNTNHLEPGYPRPLTDLGLPSTIDHIDAAMVWGHNSHTYFFSGTMYWKFDDKENTVELDYPRDMSMWRGIGYNIDTAFQWKDGMTYFFKGKGFWKFNDQRMRVVNEKQMLSAHFWMGCPGGDLEIPKTFKPKHSKKHFHNSRYNMEPTASTSAPLNNLSWYLVIIALCLVLPKL